MVGAHPTTCTKVHCHGTALYFKSTFLLHVSCRDLLYSPKCMHRKLQHKTQLHTKHNTTTMDVTIQSFDKKDHVIEVGVDDTVMDVRRNVASAVGLHEDSFSMRFGGEVMYGADVRNLSAGDTIVLTKKKDEAIAALRALGEKDLTEERLANVGDPQWACLLLQAEVASVTPNKFMSGQQFKRLGITNVSVVSRSLDSPYSGDRDVTDSNETLDFSGLSFVQGIGTQFFVNCNMLTAMDLSGMTGVTTIHDDFLRGCTGLRTVSLSGLRNVTTIGNNFMYCCSAIQTIDLSGFTNVNTIGSCFMYSCRALATFDLSGFTNVTTIGDSFMHSCAAFTTLDLSGLSCVTQVGANFLYNCRAKITHRGASRCSSIAVLERCDMEGLP